MSTKGRPDAPSALLRADTYPVTNAVFGHLPQHHQKVLATDYPLVVIERAVGDWKDTLKALCADESLDVVRRSLRYPNLALLSPVVSHDAFGWAVWLSMRHRELESAGSRDIERFLARPTEGLQKTVDISTVMWAAQSSRTAA
jgi:hypothetical protein